MSVPRPKFWWCYVVGCSLLIASAGFMNGYDVGITNGIKEMEGFRETFNLSLSLDNNLSTAGCSSTNDHETSAILGLVVSLFSLGSLVGGLLGGFLSEFTGRKSTLIIGCLLCATGVVIQTSAMYIWMLLIGKFWTGFGNGISLAVIALYIAEISPKQFRGKLVGLFPLVTTSSTLFGSVVDAGVENIHFGWRISTGLQIVVACLTILGAVFLPESPRWLIKKNKLDKAMKILRKIYHDDTISESCFNEIAASCHKSNYGKDWKQFLSWTIAHRVFIGFSLLFLSRTCGLGLTVFFSVSIFCELGVSGFIGAIVIGLSLVGFQVIGLVINDSIGRKKILLSGFAVMFLCLTATAILTMEFGFEEDSLEQTVVSYSVVIILAFFTGVTMLSIVTQAWIVTSEIFPSQISGAALSIVTTGFWLGNIVAGEISPFLLSSPLGTPGTLFLHAGVCVLGFIFVLLLIPETRKLTLEQVAHLFTQPLLKRTNSLHYLTCGRTMCYRKAIDTLPGVQDECQELIDEQKVTPIGTAMVADYNDVGPCETTV